MDDATPQAGHRCGFVTLIGKPNVGKSTLLNQLLGEKLAITSNRPQTTRNRIPGVLTRPDAQLVFIDTPGVHRAKRALNQYMVDVATEAMWETDAVVLLVEAGVGDDLQVGISDIALELLAQLKERSKPVFLVINKIDRIEKPNLLPIIAAYSALHDFEAVVPLSALRGENVDGLVDALVRVLPEGPALYPADALTDLPERFIAAELIREKLFRNLGQEVPYSTAVSIERWRDRSEDGLVEIMATIHVERASQKGIVIGKGGQMIKKLGTQSRMDLQRMLGSRVHLELFVRVDEGWTRSKAQLKALGYE
ncbi:MAG: GTPase Era [Myxococcales bacterium]|nr:GTPase Era [Myxococcales bacterium]